MSDKLAQSAMGVSVASAITSAIALSKKVRAEVSVDGSNAAMLELLEALILATEESKIDPVLLERLIQALGSGVSGFPHTENITANRIAIGALGRSYQLPDITIPNGMSIAIKGWPTNAGTIFVGGTSTGAININQIWPLLPNEIVWYKIKNAKEIYVAGDTIGDWVVYTVEQEGRF